MSSSRNDIPLTAYQDPFQQQGITFDKPLLPSVDVKNATPSEEVYENQYDSYPRPLGIWSRSHWVSFSVDFIFVGLSVLFLGKSCFELLRSNQHIQNSILTSCIALAAISISLDKTPTSRLGHHVQKAIALSPTIFPIVFAAITGKFFRTLGLFWAERGVQLGVRLSFACSNLCWLILTFLDFRTTRWMPTLICCC